MPMSLPSRRYSTRSFLAKDMMERSESDTVTEMVLASRLSHLRDLVSYSVPVLAQMSWSVA